MNIRLGTRYLRQMLDRFGGVQEYALAAYNAGDSRVADWQAAGPYSGIDEFVESIPFTRDARVCGGHFAQRGDLQGDRRICAHHGEADHSSFVTS